MNTGHRTIVASITVCSVLLALNLLVMGTSIATAQETEGPMGACCFSDGTCIVMSPDSCQKAGAIFHGIGLTCGDIICDPYGWCCLDGVCIGPSHTQFVCEGKGGEYQGDGSTECAPDSPCSIFGACCIPANGTCTIVTEPTCTIDSGEWQGPDTDCDDNDFNGNPDVCENTCPADLDTDGEIGIVDFLILLSLWGPCE